MTTVFLFITGLIVGSFLNVLIIRYDPDRGLFHKTVVGGRSRCVKCLTQLRWYELIPLVSFFVLCGKCRTCRVGISMQYPIVELVTGGIFILPFEGIFRRAFTQGVETTSVLEPATLVALLVYAVAAWGIVKFVRISSGEQQDT